MRILHYALGFPPYRTGGLTKYCMDLLLIQKEQGHEVGMLWPGQINFYNNKTSVRQTKYSDGILSFELINPLPVALDEGIKNISAFMKKGDIELYKNFLKTYNPEVVHIHTLMGLHKEFLLAAKDLRIKTVFTTHDYYGLCPKVTLFQNGSTCDDDNGCLNCVNCNKNALSLKKIMIMQSPFYRVLKNSYIIKYLRHRHRREFFNEAIDSNQETKESISKTENYASGYKNLRSYYVSMYELIDMIHFNSTIAQRIYSRYLKPRNSQVINISHKEITDNRKKKKFNGKLKITFLAPTKPFKGFNVLKEALDELWEKGYRDFELNLFSLTNNVSHYMNIQDGYMYEELESIFDNTDILVAPSVWYETFGFTVLEALSYGVPVIVSENVGAKDLLNDNFGYIISGSKESLIKIILDIINNRDQLKKMNKFIYDRFELITMDELNKSILDIYK